MNIILSLSISAPLLLTPDNFEQAKKEHKCLLVRYHSHHQDMSTRGDDDYKLVSQAFENSTSRLGVGAYDCGKYQISCFEQDVFNLPQIRIYCNKNYDLYDGGGSFESIIKWSKNISHAEAGHVKQLVATPNGKTFKTIIDEHNCVFAFFHTPWCNPCKRFMPRLRRIARLYSDIDSIAFTETDVDRYRTFLRDYELHIFPELRLFVKGESKPIDYEGKRSPKNIVEFINHYCGTHKQLTENDDDFGLVDEANTLVEDFLANNYAVTAIQKMRSIPGTSYYIEVMEDIIDKGTDWINDERDRFRDKYESPHADQRDKSLFRRKANILSFFLEIIDSSR